MAAGTNLPVMNTTDGPGEPDSPSIHHFSPAAAGPRPHSGQRRWRFGAAALVLVLASACGSPDASNGSGGSGAKAVEAVTEAVQAAYTGTYAAPPTEPTSPPAGLEVWVISCGQAAIGCATVAGGAQEAAELVGWDVTLYDGKLGADNAYATGVRQAVAAGADAIILASIDCAAVRAPLEEAKAQGVTVIGALAYDCDDQRIGGGDPLFAANVIPNAQQPTVSDYAREAGRVKADWVIERTDGKAVALSLTHSDSLFGSDIAAGFDDELETCETCELISLPFTYAELGTGQVPAKVSQALVRTPTINAVTTPYDSLMILGVAQAIVRSGRQPEIASVGGEGYPPNLELIQQGAGQDAAVYQAADWFGWAAVDTLSRVLNDQEAQPSGIGLQLVDAEHLPVLVDDQVEPPVDFKALYRETWGR